MLAPGDAFIEQRREMVERDISGRGIADARVLAAMVAVPRERFVSPDLAESAFDDRALPIEQGQTISQPLIVAAMAAAAHLTPVSRVLEVGTGSGYGAAVLGWLAAEVWTIERHAPLAGQARCRLRDLGYDNVHVVHSDGTLGLADKAPFDAIVVTAGAATVPRALLDQLVEGGRMVIPVGPTNRRQKLMRIQRVGEDFVEQDFGAVRFVPLIAGALPQPPESLGPAS